MKPPVGKWQWITFAASAGACAAVFEFTRFLQPGRLVGDPALAALQADLETLRPNNDSARAELQRQWKGMHAGALNPAKLGALRRKLGTAWTWQALPGVPGAAFHEATISREHARLNDWPQILATVETLNTQTGLRLAGVEIDAIGRGEQRHFARVTLHVRWLEGVGAGKGRETGFVPRPLPVSGPRVAGRGRGRRARALAGPHFAASLAPVPTPAPAPFRG